MKLGHDIEQWLHCKHVYSTPVYLSGTSILLGRQFILPPYNITYRIEAASLIVCELSRLPQMSCQPPQLFHLWAIFRGMFISHPQLKHLAMLVLTDTFDAKQSAQRYQLQRVLLSLGAFFTTYAGDDWLILNAEKVIKRR